MRQLLQLVIGLFACLAVASALPGLFPRNNVVTYRYYADVKTGTIEPKPFASQFVITGLMHVTPELRNSTLKNAFYIVLNVTHGIRNGEIQHFEKLDGNTLPIPDAARVLNDPFIVIFENTGKLKSLMINEHEAGWSRNIKQSIASMLQLDLSYMHLEAPIKPHAFLIKENTIYGECAVTYDVHRTLDLEEGHFTVTKMMEPKSCSKFDQHTFNSKESMGCLVEAEDEMTTASRRVFHVEKTGEDLLIKSLVAHGVINYFPWKANSEADYVLANQSMECESIVPAGSIELPELNMGEMVTLNDVTFRRSESLYAANAGVDPTHGRHVVNLEVLIARLMSILGEAVDYMNENNLEMTSPEMEHGQTINRILDTMTRMDLLSLEHVFNNMIEGVTPRELTMTNLFLNIVPFVGTNATSLFTRNIIRKNKIEDLTAVTMLTRLPYNIREPSESLLIEMEDLMRFGSEISLKVRKAGILCFATMIYKAHEHDSYLRALDSELVNRWVQYYFDHVISEPTFEMKMVFLQGMRNIQIGGVHKLLEPMIRGEQKISEKPDHLRLHALLINWRTGRDVEYIHNLCWPILSDTQLPLELRVAAYQILLEPPLRMERLMSLYWLMVYEKNEHLYNFHYTAMKSLANTVNSCLTPMKEMARKLLRFIRVRPGSADITTGAWTVDFENREFGFGESMSLLTVADEHTGTPFAGFIEYATLARRKPVNQFGAYLRVEGVDAFNHIMWNTTMPKPDIFVKEIERLLTKAGEDMPQRKPTHIEYVVMVQGRTVFAGQFDSIPEPGSIMAMFGLAMNMRPSWQHVGYDELYTMEVPNDLGLPTHLLNRIPHVSSMQASNVVTSQTSPLYSMKVESSFKASRNGYYSMEVYNPMIDTWHAIRRMTTYDVSLPISMSISYNHETSNLKLHWPILPPTQYSISGIRSYVKNYVMIMEAEDGILERYGGNVRESELVTRGLEHRRNTTLMNLDSKDTGLRFSMYQYDCERVTPPKTRAEISDEMVNENDKNTWDNAGILAAMIAREHYLHRFISPESGTCGHLTRLEPSIMYPTSEVDINMRVSVETPGSTTLVLLPAKKLNIRATLEAKAAATDIPLQSWVMNLKMSTSQGHVNNQLQFQMTRSTPGQTDLQICIDAYKIYPAVELDPLTRNPTTNQEVIGKITMNMGVNENGTCVRDGISLIINMKGELSGEQRETIKRDLVDGLCQKDIENPLYMYTESSIVPRTPACLREAMLHTILRKYSYTVFYQNIPEGIVPTVHWFAEELRRKISSDVTYLPAHTEPGIIKIFAEIPQSIDEGINLIVRTPTHEEKYSGIDAKHYEEMIANLESTQFSSAFMDSMKKKEIKHCVIYPEILLNSDGAVMPFTVPGQWTLLTGDHIGHMFSVFVKRLEPKKLGLLMTVRNHTVEVIPSATIPTVTLDGNVINYVNGGTLAAGSSYILRMTWSGNRLVIQSMYTSFDLEWTERSVSLAMNVKLQGKVTGLCGHLDGTHTERMARVYSFGS